MKRAILLFSGALIGVVGNVSLNQPEAPRGAIAAVPDSQWLSVFGDVFSAVRSEYVEAPDELAMVEAAIKAMVSSLDPHSAYLSPKDFRDMQVQTSGRFGGLGMEVSLQDGGVKVNSVLEGNPAARGGVLANDKIVSIDGEAVGGMTLEQAVGKMRGAVNTPVRLSIVRDGLDAPLNLSLMRAEITITSVRGEAKGDIGYIRISAFSEQTTTELRALVDKIGQQIGTGLKGWVVDLRNNPGGLLNQAVRVSDAFINNGGIVSVRGRKADQRQQYDARTGDITSGKPLVVLINGGSASASEIVAGALQDSRRATIIGTQSFGKGSVQTIIPLGADGALRLTTARYYTPSGRSIQAQGITPDTKVIQELPAELAARYGDRTTGESSLRGHLANDDSASAELAGSLAYVPPDPKDDKQLNYALDFLRGVQAAAAPSQRAAN
jgi:carboxyl-terminal processing protease